MDRVAFITGGGGYIGSEVALTLAKAGYTIAVNDINEAAVKRTVARITSEGGEAAGYVADVSDCEDITKTIDKAADGLGSLDVLVHVAGGSARIAGKNARYVPLAEQDPAVIERVLQVNLLGALWADRAAAKRMIEQKTGGRIVNFSSTVAFNGLVTCADYAASKGGINSLTKALAKELGPHGITVNAVAPGVVQRPEERNDAYARSTNLLGEKCEASDIAGIVEFLVSDRARFVTGQVWLCDGGRTLSMKGTD